MSEVEPTSDRAHRGRTQRISTDEPAIGLVATAENGSDVAATILRAQQRGHEVIVSVDPDTDAEGVTFARKLGALITGPNEHEKLATSHRECLVETAKQWGFPGLLVVSQLPDRVDYDASREKLKSVDTFSVSATIYGQTNTGSRVLGIVPAYNEEDTIEDIVCQTKPFVDEIIVINDGSVDGTASVAEEVADGVISLPKNLGVGGAVHTGYLAAIRGDFDIVVQIDGDGQHNPEYIPKILETMEEEEADMVIGSRWLNGSYKEYSFVRRAGIKFFTLEANVLGGLDISDVTSGYRAYSVDMLSDLGRPDNSHWALEQTLEAARKDYIIREVSIPMKPETTGSQFNLETFLKYPPRMVLTSLKVLLFR